MDPSDLELLGEILNVLIPAERWVDAVAAYDRALTAHPRNSTLLMARGRIQRTTGRPIGAYESYRRASELEPESVDAHMQLGLVLIELELWSESIEALSGAISGDPDNYQAHHLMGDALMRIGEYERAIPVLARAQTLAPAGSVDDSSYRALAYLQLGRPEDALALIDLLLQKAPTNMELHYRRASPCATWSCSTFRVLPSCTWQIDHFTVLKETVTEIKSQVVAHHVDEPLLYRFVEADHLFDFGDQFRRQAAGAAVFRFETTGLAEPQLVIQAVLT